MNHIYVVFSATPYLIGRAIRRITGEKYNHASIALDPDLTQMYSFARRHYRTPFYGGFVKESHARYHVGSKASQICICKIPVTQAQFAATENKLTIMYNRSDHYIYNHISALSALLHKQIPAKDAYTCVEFCAKILHDLGMDIDPTKYYSVCDLEKLLSEYVIYTGPMPADDKEDPAYYAKQPVRFPFLITLRDICKLLPRLNKQKQSP